MVETQHACEELSALGVSSVEEQGIPLLLDQAACG
jgi:hypothetical protein